MSKIATLFGIIFGLVMIGSTTYDFQSNQLISAFFNLQALLLVLGGTFAAILVNYSFEQIGCAYKGFVKVLTTEPARPDLIVEELVEFSHLSKHKGLLELEKHVDRVQTPFLKYSIGEMLLYKDRQELEKKLQSQLIYMRLRHQTCQEVYENMATYAPAFGMMGTVMGLIIMMTSQLGGSDASAYAANSADSLSGLLVGMGLALVTTFYGVLFANLFFLPIAGKLKILSDAEVVQNEMVIEAIMAMKDAESSLMVRERLLAYLDQKALNALS